MSVTASAKVKDVIANVLSDLEAYKKNVKRFKSNVLAGNEAQINLVLETVEHTLLEATSTKPIVLLNSLRLLKECMDSKNTLMASKLNKHPKILPKMLKFALFDPQNEDDDRGSMLFGKNAGQENEIIGNSIVRLCLECFLFWSYLYQTDFDSDEISTYLDAYEQLAQKNVKFPEKINYFKHALKEMQQQQQQQQQTSTQQPSTQGRQEGQERIDQGNVNPQPRGSKTGLNISAEPFEQVKEEEFEESTDIMPDIEANISSFNAGLLRFELALSNNPNNSPLQDEEIKAIVKEIEKFASNARRYVDAINQSGNPVLKSKYSFYLDSLLGKATNLREIFREYSAQKKGYIEFRNKFLEVTNPDLLAIILQEDKEKAKEQEKSFTSESEEFQQQPKSVSVRAFQQIDGSDVQWETQKFTSGKTSIVPKSVRDANGNAQSAQAAVAGSSETPVYSERLDSSKDLPSQQLFYLKDRQNSKSGLSNNLLGSEEKKSSSRYENQDGTDPAIIRSFKKQSSMNPKINSSTVSSSIFEDNMSLAPVASATQAVDRNNLNASNGYRNQKIQNDSQESQTAAGLQLNGSGSGFINKNGISIKEFNEITAKYNSEHEKFLEATALLRSSERDKAALERELNAINSKNQVNQYQNLMKIIQVLSDEVQKIKSQVQSIRTENSRLIEENERLKEESVLLQGQIEGKQSDLQSSSLISDFHSLSFENDTMRKEIMRLNAEITKKTTELTSKNSEMSEWAREKERMEALRVREKSEKEMKQQEDKLREDSRVNAERVLVLEREKKSLQDLVERLENLLEVARREQHSAELNRDQSVEIIIDKNKMVQQEKARLSTQVILLQEQIKRQAEYQSDLEGQLQAVLSRSVGDERQSPNQENVRRTSQSSSQSFVRNLQELVTQKQEQIELLQATNVQLKEHIEIIQSNNAKIHGDQFQEKLYLQQTQIDHLTQLVTTLKQTGQDKLTQEYLQVGQKYEDQDEFESSGLRRSGSGRKAIKMSASKPGFQLILTNTDEDSENASSVPRQKTFENFSQSWTASFPSEQLNGVGLSGRSNLNPIQLQQHQQTPAQIAAAASSIFIRTQNLFDDSESNSVGPSDQLTSVVPTTSTTTHKPEIYRLKKIKSHQLCSSNEGNLAVPGLKINEKPLNDLLNLSDYLKSKTHQQQQQLQISTSSRGSANIQLQQQGQVQQFSRERRSMRAFGRPSSSQFTPQKNFQYHQYDQNNGTSAVNLSDLMATAATTTNHANGNFAYLKLDGSMMDSTNNNTGMINNGNSINGLSTTTMNMATTNQKRNVAIRPRNSNSAIGHRNSLDKTATQQYLQYQNNFSISRETDATITITKKSIRPNSSRIPSSQQSNYQSSQQQQQLLLQQGTSFTGTRLVSSRNTPTRAHSSLAKVAQLDLVCDSSDAFDGEPFSTTQNVGSSVDHQKKIDFYQSLIYPFSSSNPARSVGGGPRSRSAFDDTKGSKVQDDQELNQSFKGNLVSFGVGQTVISTSSGQLALSNQTLNYFQNACIQEKGILFQNQIVKVTSLTSYIISQQSKRKCLNLALHFSNLSQSHLKILSFSVHPSTDIQVKMSPNPVTCGIPSKHKIKVNFRFELNQFPFLIPSGVLRIRQNEVEHQFSIALPITLLKFTEQIETNSQEFMTIWNSIGSDAKFRSSSFEVNKILIPSNKNLIKIFPQGAELIPEEGNEFEFGVKGNFINLQEYQQISARSSSPIPVMRTQPNLIQPNSSSFGFENQQYFIRFAIKQNKKMEIQLGLNDENLSSSIASAFLDSLLFLFKA